MTSTFRNGVFAVTAGIAILVAVLWSSRRMAKPEPSSAIPDAVGIARKPDTKPTSAGALQSPTSASFPHDASATSSIQAPSVMSIAVVPSSPAMPVPTPHEKAPPAAAVFQPNPDEVAATARMYAAHVSLRTSEVANPDSVTNRAILQAMVTKAFARQVQSTSAVKN